MKLLFKIICSLALVAITTSVSAQSASENKTQTKDVQKEQTIKIKVSGLNCGGDMKDIQKSVAAIEGVSSCNPQGKVAANTVFEITFNPAITSEKEIQKVIEGKGACDNPNARPYKVKQG